MGVAARVWLHVHGRVDQKRYCQAASGRAWNRMPRSLLLGAIRSGIGAGLRGAVERRARPRPGDSSLIAAADPRTLEPWGFTSFKGRWYVIGRDGDRAGHPDVQAVADDRSAQEGLPSRRRTRSARLDLREGRPARSRRGSRERPRCWPSVLARRRVWLAAVNQPPPMSNFQPASWCAAVRLQRSPLSREEITQYAADVVVLEARRAAGAGRPRPPLVAESVSAA